MVASAIKYTQTEDGVNIAYWTVGSGLPVVHVYPPVLSHLELEMQSPAVSGWYAKLAQHCQIVRYNPRNSGLSDDGIADMSAEAMAMGVEAVVNAIEAPRYALIAHAFMGIVGLNVAHRNAEEIAGLILVQGFASSRGSFAGFLQAGVAAGDFNADFWAETTASNIDTNRSEVPGPFSKINRESVDWSAEAFHARMDAYGGYDASHLLGAVRTPILVIHYQDGMVPTMAEARSLAAGLSDAQLVLRAGKAQFWFDEDVDGLVDVVGDFVRSIDEPGSQADPVEGAAGRFRTILFTDVEASTALTDHFGDVKARDLLREHERLTRDALSANGGIEIKTMGDGFMASFTSASSALDAAIAMQQAITAHFTARETPIRIRVGINAGEPIEEGDDLYGASVIRAARVMGQANGGEILVTNVVRELVEGKEYLFSQRGEANLKGFEEAVRLFEVSWRAAGE